MPTEMYGTISLQLCTNKWQDEGVLPNPFLFPSDFGLPGQSCPYTSVGCCAACVTLSSLFLNLSALFTLSMHASLPYLNFGLVGHFFCCCGQLRANE